MNNQIEKVPNELDSITIKLMYQSQIKLCPSSPSTINALQVIIKSIFSPCPYILLAADPTGDLITLCQNRDLKYLYKTVEKSSEKILKIHIWPKNAPLPTQNTGISTYDEFLSNHAKKLIKFTPDQSDMCIAMGIEYNITREGVSYICKYLDKIFTNAGKKAAKVCGR